MYKISKKYMFDNGAIEAIEVEMVVKARPSLCGLLLWYLLNVFSG